MVTTFTYKPSLVRIDAWNFRVIVVTYKHTHRQGRLQYTVPQLSAQCKNEEMIVDGDSAILMWHSGYDAGLAIRRLQV